jgi:hypothetical protein
MKRKAMGSGASAQSTGGFDRLPRIPCAIYCCPRMPEGIILASQTTGIRGMLNHIWRERGHPAIPIPLCGFERGQHSRFRGDGISAFFT